MHYDQKYYSFNGSMDVPTAIKCLGADHVQYLLGDWQDRISRGVSNSWIANNGRSHIAYCTLMQAGSIIVEQHL